MNYAPFQRTPGIFTSAPKALVVMATLFAALAIVVAALFWIGAAFGSVGVLLALCFLLLLIGLSPRDK